MCEGRKKEDVMYYYNHLRENKLSEKIVAASTDFSSGYLSCASESLENCDCVGDLFHLMKRYGHPTASVKRDIILFYRISAEIMDLMLNKKQCYITHEKNKLVKMGFPKDEIEEMIKDPSNDKIKEYRDKADLLESNRYVLIFGLKKILQSDLPEDYKKAVINNKYILEVLECNDKLRDLYDINTTPEKSEKIIEELLDICAKHFNKSMKSFGKFLKTYRRNLITACKHNISNSMVEGVNSECKVIQRLMRGVKDVKIYIAKVFRHFRMNNAKKLYRQSLHTCEANA